VCTKSISKSVRNLRTCLVDANITPILLKLLDDPLIGVRESATAAICNIVLDFSPLKHVVIEGGGVGKLIAMVNEGGSETLVVNGLWALKNLVYMADSEVKRGVVDLLSYETLYRLCMSEVGTGRIREQAVAILRNLVSASTDDVIATVDGLGSHRIVEIITSALESGTGNVNVLVQALYVMVNIATSVRQGDKDMILGSTGLVSAIYENLVCYYPNSFQSHDLMRVRIAAVWIVINLTWNEESGGDRGRVKGVLENAGILRLLKEMQGGDELELADRATCALEQIEDVDVGGGAESSGSAEVMGDVDMDL
jgi:hypothetical protein